MVKSSKDSRDPFFRQSKTDGYRARSAYKLIHIDEHFGILNNVTRAVDLCAAPGSWSQVLSRRLSKDALIVSVDLQAMAPIPGVIQLRGDITQPSTSAAILSHFHQEKADLIICDGAPEVTGLHELDEFMQSSLLLSSLLMAASLLAPGGSFVTKIFTGPNTISFHQEQFQLFFRQVTLYKPPSSRPSSAEHFFVCKDFTDCKDHKAFLRSGSFQQDPSSIDIPHSARSAFDKM